MAACVQHEIDHLNGVLFIDHISRLKRDMIVRRVLKDLRQTGGKDKGVGMTRRADHFHGSPGFLRSRPSTGLPKSMTSLLSIPSRHGVRAAG